MYNGIGLQTARGTGTNGYVQANLSNLLLSKKRVEYNSEADLRRAEAEINKGPNEEILQHQRKRVIEMKCAEFEMLMEEKGFDDDEIQKKVSDYRTLLLSQLESGELNLDSELGTKDSHARAKAAAKGRDRLKNALGLSDDFVPGASMKNMNKSDVVGAAMEPAVSASDSLLSNLKRQVKKKSGEDKKKRKKRRHESTSSSSSPSSSSSSDSSDSSEDSSSEDSDESSSSEEVPLKKRKKEEIVKKKSSKKVDEDERSRNKRLTEHKHSSHKKELERTRHRENAGRHKDSIVRKHRSCQRTPSEDIRREGKRDDHGKDQRQTSRTRNDKGHEQSLERPIKQELPFSDEEDKRRTASFESLQRTSSGRQEGPCSPAGSRESSESESDSCDNLKYKMKSTVNVIKR